MRVKNIQIWVSMVRCNVIYNLLSWPPLPPAGAVGGVQGGLLLGAVLIAPVIPMQAILFSLLNSSSLVLSLTPRHHVVAAQVTMGPTSAVYIQYTTFGFNP
jgi:hypothetical protein